MRYLTIPKDLKLAMLLDPETKQPGMAYPFRSFLGEYVWPQKSLRDRPGLAMALIEKLEDAKAGDVVELTDGEHEALEQTAKAAEYAPIFAAKFMRYHVAIAGAPSKDPRPQPAADAPEN